MFKKWNNIIQIGDLHYSLETIWVLKCNYLLYGRQFEKIIVMKSGGNSSYLFLNKTTMGGGFISVHVYLIYIYAQFSLRLRWRIVQTKDKRKDPEEKNNIIILKKN